VRDVGKALGLPEAQLDKLAKRCEGGRARDLAEEMARLPEFRDKVNAPLWRDLVVLARQIDGFPRHVSQHVGGMIISSRPLVEMVPVMPAAMPGRVVCQWDKDSVDDAGFIKIDFLALGMLSLVEECVELIAESYGCPRDEVKAEVARILDRRAGVLGRTPLPVHVRTGAAATTDEEEPGETRPTAHSNPKVPPRSDRRNRRSQPVLTRPNC
jgi:DNA polymerase III alpha subunit